MKKIILEQLELTNFKGIQKLIIPFNPEITNISGRNATGKTTIFDSFTWLLYGKNTAGNAEFGIKTLDKYNVVIPKIEHSVKGLFNVDGNIVVFERILREKWQKKRGEETAEFAGNETAYFVNEVPCSEKEYKQKISEIIEESVFKMLTSPFAFQSLKWNERRDILIKIAGGVDVSEMIKNNQNYQKLYNEVKIINTNMIFDFDKCFEDWKKTYSAKKKNIKEELQLIPARLDEVQKTIPQQEPDYTIIANDIEIKTREVDILQEQIEDKTKQSEQDLNAKLEVQKQINSLKSQMQKIEFDEQSKIDKTFNDNKLKYNSINSQISILNSNLSGKKQILTNKYELLKQYQDKITSLIKEFAEINKTELVFDEADFSCPTCKREFEKSDIKTTKQGLIKNFYNDKVAKLTKINESGTSAKKFTQELSENIQVIEKEIIEIEKEIITKENELKDVEKIETSLTVNLRLLKVPEYIKLQDKIKELEKPIEEQKPADVSDLKLSIQNLRNEIDNLKIQLQVKDQVLISKKRIAEIEKNANSLGQSLADLEKLEYIASQFTKDKINSIETKINSMFKFVRFKMFNILVNGSEEECCDTLINTNGSFVSWQDANNGGCINAGLDIINTLSVVKNVAAPIFIDNSESVNTLIETKAQIIRLVVTNDENLVF